MTPERHAAYWLCIATCIITRCWPYAGDAFNMRHPLTGGGMTVALSDAALLSDMLQPLPSFADQLATAHETAAFYTKRKPLSATINTLANALYRVSTNCCFHRKTGFIWARRQTSSFASSRLCTLSILLLACAGVHAPCHKHIGKLHAAPAGVLLHGRQGSRGDAAGVLRLSAARRHVLVGPHQPPVRHEPAAVSTGHAFLYGGHLRRGQVCSCATGFVGPSPACNVSYTRHPCWTAVGCLR